MNKPTKIALQGYTGWGAGDKRHADSGMWQLSDLIAERIPQENIACLSVRPWNSACHLDAQVTSTKPDLIVVFGHSYGCGRAIAQFCDALASRGSHVDLALYFDPVLYYPLLRPISRWVAALVPDKKKFPLPKNVYRYSLFRTVNNGFGTPWGRDIESNTAATCVRHVTVGTPQKLNEWRIDPNETQIVTDAANHGSIDNLKELHEMCIEDIGNLLRAAQWPL